MRPNGRTAERLPFGRSNGRTTERPNPFGRDTIQIFEFQNNFGVKKNKKISELRIFPHLPSDVCSSIAWLVVYGTLQ